MRVIGISGQKRSGKDTLADILLPALVDMNIGPWDRLAFADGVKDVMCMVLGVSRDWIETWKTKDEIPPGWSMTTREALINIGDRFREIRSDCWLRRVVRLGKKNKLITDVRYKNEAQEVRKLGELIRIHRPGQETLNNKSETDLLEYDKIMLASETDGPVKSDLVPYTFFILNSGSIAELREKITMRLIPYLADSIKFFL